MKEMKVIRKRRRRHRGGGGFSGGYISTPNYRRRYHSTNFLLKAVIICSVLTIVTAGALCLKFFVFDRNNDAPEVKSGVIENNKSASLILKTGDRMVLAVAADDEAMNKLQFVSSNPSVLTVDSGGRIDALSTGKSTVSASCDGYYGECVITVEQGEQENPPAEYTTAIVDNLDVLEKNIEDGSKNPYRVTVNRRTNTVTVYTYDDSGNYTVPVRAMVCSCGEMNEENITIAGVFEVYFKNRWHALFGDVYGQYVTGFSGDYLFHSVPYTKTSENSLKGEEFNKLSTNASQGCVRMMIVDTKWVYDNLEIGTVVEVIDAGPEKDPLGTPLTVKVDNKSKWDPTDPHEDNPYLNKQPVITGAQDVTIKQGESYNPTITAIDSCMMDATDKIEIVGNVNTNKKGTYYVTYILTDALKKHTEVTVTVTVE